MSYEIPAILVNSASALVGTWTRDLSLTKGNFYILKLLVWLMLIGIYY